MRKRSKKTLYTGKPKTKELPSLYKKSRLIKVKKELAKTLSKHLKIEENEAENIVNTDEGWNEYLKYEDRRLTVTGLYELMPELHKTAIKKAKSGWTANAKDAVVAMNILKEKLIDNTTQLNVAGKNVQINLGWKFKPYKSK